MQGENKRRNLKIGGFLIIVFLAIYIPSLFHWIYGRTISTEIIRMDTIEDSITTEGCIIRDEEVIKSPIDGICITEVNDGEKVSANFRVATVLNNSSEKLLNELKELDLRIIKAQKEKENTQDFFSEDVLKIEGEIDQKIKLLVVLSNSNSLTDIKKVREAIDNLIQKKATIVGDKSTQDVFLNDLKKQKLSLQEQINSNTRLIDSSSSGIVSYTVDGYEDTLNTKAFKELTPKFLESIKNKEQSSKSINKNVSASQPFMKIIKGIDCYVVVSLESMKVKFLKEDDNAKIRINDINKTIDGIISYKSNEIDGKRIIAIKIDKGISETSDLRKISVDLIQNSYKGLKVPLKSLVELDLSNMKAKIVLVKANYSSIRKVKIIGNNEGTAIIESMDESNNSVGLYDVYVVNPENIQEGQLITQ